MISFKEWLEKRVVKNETMTSTADIANFSRPLVFQDEDKKKASVIRRMKKDENTEK
jgi:hypothetical protein